VRHMPQCVVAVAVACTVVLVVVLLELQSSLFRAHGSGCGVNGGLEIDFPPKSIFTAVSAPSALTKARITASRTQTLLQIGLSNDFETHPRNAKPNARSFPTFGAKSAALCLRIARLLLFSLVADTLGPRRTYVATECPTTPKWRRRRDCF